MKTDLALQVFDVGFSLGVDGPGQRMVIYTKGCNLSCPWCAAPESVHRQSDVLFYPSRLSNSRQTGSLCPHGAVTLIRDTVQRDSQLCAQCCDYTCTTGGNPAFQLVGKAIPLNDLFDKAVRYRPFYGHDGGVTVGGGEPTCQLPELHELLKQLKRAHFHTVIETNGTNQRLPELYPEIDLLYIDCKHPDDARCQEIVGVGNRTVTQNIRTRHNQGGAMVVRIPLVPGYNDDISCLHGFGELLSDIGPLHVEVLPFHKRGETKWKALGLTAPTHSVTPPSHEVVENAKTVLSAYGLQVK
ncbi:MAG TPA: glycyl-radical enzyme activating protein [Armatimonadota bacterium]|nr:glycyl-radical enzyme activating protein [Armatimonadota bacterium]